MPSLAIQDPISGEPRVIKNPLLAEHIQVGRTLWYDGFTSVGSWSCPAVITKVDAKKKRFKVRSLDDMREQTQWYDFSAKCGSSHSRSTMRLTTSKEVGTYLKQQRASLKSEIASTKWSYDNAVRELRNFDEVRSSLKF